LIFWLWDGDRLRCFAREFMHHDGNLMLQSCRCSCSPLCIAVPLLKSLELSKGLGYANLLIDVAKPFKMISLQMLSQL